MPQIPPSKEPQSNEPQTKERILAYSPVGMDLSSKTGFGTLLFACSRSCNLSCNGCWTAAAEKSIQEQLKTGAGWLYDSSFGIHLLDFILEEFSKKHGQLVACMSDGEPLVPANYDFILNLSKSCGRNGLPFLLFTNGILLGEQKISELEQAANGKISFSISLQTGRPQRYGEFVLSKGMTNGIDRSGSAGSDAVFDNLVKNYNSWKRFNKRVLARTGKHGIALHTYLIPGKTMDSDMESLKPIVEVLGNIPWVVTTMSAPVSETLNGLDEGSLRRAQDMVKQYHTGPTATLSFGQTEEEKICAYIPHGFYPLQNPRGVFGITINPFYDGQIQTCPYHSQIGTAGWFTLKEYCRAMVNTNSKGTPVNLGSWLEEASIIATTITVSAYRILGYEHCLMRHSGKSRMEAFVKGVNESMTNRRQMESWDPSALDYFSDIKNALKEVIQSVSNKLV